MYFETNSAFDFGSPIEFYPGDFPAEVIARASELVGGSIDHKDALCLALRETIMLGSLAAADQQPDSKVA